MHFTLFLLVFAPFAGSFLGVVIRRLGKASVEPFDRKGFLAGRSMCPHCRTTLAPVDLIPFLSWISTRGTCRYCHARLGGFYPAVEAAALAIAIVAVAGTSTPFDACIACGLGWTLLCLAWIDAEHLFLPDELTLPLLLAGLVLAAFDGQVSILDAALGAAAGYGVFAGIDWLYRRIRGQRGLGEGDAKLLAAAGAWLGWRPLDAVVLCACFSGLFAAILAHGLGHKMVATTKIPFGPFLALGFWLTYLFFGNADWWAPLPVFQP